MLTAVIVAAGGSQRMGFDKLFADLNGRPVLAYTLAAFDACPAVTAMVIVAHPDRQKQCRQLAEREVLTKVAAVVPGGPARHWSVHHGLEAVGPEAAFVAVHDGARPLVTPALIETCLAAARQTGAAAVAAPVTDTLKRARDADGLRVSGGVDRTDLWAMQTPQIFAAPLLRRAYAAVVAAGQTVTDEVSAVEALGEPVVLVPNPQWNVKVTYPRDLALVQMALRWRGQMEFSQDG